MIWKKDKLKPTQPYFVFDTMDFYQEVFLQQGISHFYNYQILEDTPLRIVPDACIDLLFEYDGIHTQGYVCGTSLEYTCRERKGIKEVFGIRFMPGTQPQFIACSMKELLGNRIPIESVLVGDQSWLKKMENEDFYQKIRTFLEVYAKTERQKKKPFGKEELIQTIKQLVYDTDGKIKVSEIGEKTGYSDRYIDKVFIDQMGFSPKTFCKIIQFQRALELMNYGTPDKFADVAIELGYYDQAQFIRDFSRYAGLSPRKYLKLVEKLQYKNRIKEMKRNR